MRRILVVDDHPIVLQVMTAIAESVFPQAHVAAAECLFGAQQLVAASDPIDLALIDLGLPGCHGVSALTQFRAISPVTATVVISANEETSIVRAALNAGAKGYIPKTAKPCIIADALRLVGDGGIFVPLQALSEAGPPAASEALTERQQQVLRLIAQGLPNKEIARRLSIAEDTVKQHAKAVYAALGISSRSQAARAADRCGIKLD